MPYIEKTEREKFDKILDLLHTTQEGLLIQSPGELNYLITVICLLYVQNKVNYQTFCEIEGVLSHVSKELYQRLVHHYEENKRIENEDIPLLHDLILSTRRIP